MGKCNKWNLRTNLILLGANHNLLCAKQGCENLNVVWGLSENVHKIPVVRSICIPWYLYFSSRQIEDDLYLVHYNFRVKCNDIFFFNYEVQ